MIAQSAMLTDGQPQTQVPLVVSIAGLILAVILLFGVFVWLRKRMLNDAPDSGEVLSIGTVRRLHREGKITDEEFAALRRAALLAAGMPGDRVDADGKKRHSAADDRSGPAVSPGSDVIHRTRDGGLRARPGYDLTGERLPGHEDEEPPRG